MKIRDERGAIMIESTYCILLAIFVLMFFLSFGFRLYQQTMVGIVANEISEEVVLTYKLKDVPNGETLSSKKIADIGLFRYLLRTKSFQTSNESKAEKLAKTRLAQTSLAKSEGAVNVRIEPIVDDVGRRHYAITVEKKYSFLLGGLLKIVGMDGTETVTDTVYVESMDVLHYVNTVKMTKYGLDKLSEDSAFCSLVNSAISLLNSIFG